MASTRSMVLTMFMAQTYFSILAKPTHNISALAFRKRRSGSIITTRNAFVFTSGELLVNLHRTMRDGAGKLILRKGC